MKRAQRGKVALMGAVVPAMWSSAAAAQFPTKFHGVWADSALTCRLYRERPSAITDRQSWILVTPHEITGTTKGKFLRVVSPARVQFRTPDIDTPSELELHQNGILEEGVVGARATMSYFRCLG